MDILKTTCNQCGSDLELSPHQVRLVIYSVRSRSYYTFYCTTCAENIRKPAGEEAIRILQSTQVYIERLPFPAEALEEHHDPPLRLDEVLDFALWLQFADPYAMAIAFETAILADNQ